MESVLEVRGGRLMSALVLSDNGTFRVEVETSSQTLLICPIGPINEDVQFKSVLDLIGQLGEKINHVIVDLGKVISMNSVGVRTWILFLEQLQHRKENVIFTKVNEIFIEQASIVPNLLGKIGTPIRDFYVPYYCSLCETSERSLVPPEDLPFVQNRFQAPKKKCKNCQGELELDAIEEEYFGFVKALRKKT